MVASLQNKRSINHAPVIFSPKQTPSPASDKVIIGTLELDSTYSLVHFRVIPPSTTICAPVM